MDPESFVKETTELSEPDGHGGLAPSEPILEDHKGTETPIKRIRLSCTTLDHGTEMAHSSPTKSIDPSPSINPTLPPVNGLPLPSSVSAATDEPPYTEERARECKRLILPVLLDTAKHRFAELQTGPALDEKLDKLLTFNVVEQFSKTMRKVQRQLQEQKLEKAQAAARPLPTAPKAMLKDERVRLREDVFLKLRGIASPSLDLSASPSNGPPITSLENGVHPSPISSAPMRQDSGYRGNGSSVLKRKRSRLESASPPPKPKVYGRTGYRSPSPGIRARPVRRSSSPPPVRKKIDVSPEGPRGRPADGKRYTRGRSLQRSPPRRSYTPDSAPQRASRRDETSPRRGRSRSADRVPRSLNRKASPSYLGGRKYRSRSRSPVSPFPILSRKQSSVKRGRRSRSRSPRLHRVNGSMNRSRTRSPISPLPARTRSPIRRGRRSLSRSPPKSSSRLKHSIKRSSRSPLIRRRRSPSYSPKPSLRRKHSISRSPRSTVSPVTRRHSPRPLRRLHSAGNHSPVPPSARRRSRSQSPRYRGRVPTLSPEPKSASSLRGSAHRLPRRSYSPLERTGTYRGGERQKSPLPRRKSLHRLPRHIHSGHTSPTLHNGSRSMSISPPHSPILKQDGSHIGGDDLFYGSPSPLNTHAMNGELNDETSAFKDDQRTHKLMLSLSTSAHEHSVCPPQPHHSADEEDTVMGDAVAGCGDQANEMDTSPTSEKRTNTKKPLIGPTARFHLSKPLEVPGMWFLQQSNHPEVMICNFDVDEDIAKDWGLQGSHKSLQPKNRISLQLLCLSPDDISQVNHEQVSGADLVNALQPSSLKWPTRGSLIVEVNLGTSFGKIWLPHEQDAGLALDLTDNISQGQNTIRIIQLVHYPCYFVLLACEVPSFSQFESWLDAKILARPASRLVF